MINSTLNFWAKETPFPPLLSCFLPGGLLQQQESNLDNSLSAILELFYSLIYLNISRCGFQRQKWQRPFREGVRGGKSWGENVGIGDEIHEVRPNVEVLRHRKGWAPREGSLGSLITPKLLGGDAVCWAGICRGKVSQRWTKKSDNFLMQWLFPVTHATIIWLIVFCFLFFKFCPHYLITVRL